MKNQKGKKSLSEIIAHGTTILYSSHPITFGEIEVKEFDGHNFWIECEDGEGMTIAKSKVVKLFTIIHEEVERLFKENF